MQMWTLRGLGKGVSYIAIGLKGRENNIEEPEEEKDGGGDVLEHSVAAKLGALPVLAEDGQEPPGHDQADGDHRADDVDRHREGQSARLHLEAIGTGEMVTGSDDPGKTKAEEDVDGVAAGDVADRVVRVLLVHGRGLAGEGVREGGAQGHEGDRGHFVLQADQASKDAREVAHDDHNDPDEQERDEKAGEASEQSSWRDEGEDDLEGEGEEVHDVVGGAGTLDVASVHHHGILHLLSPCLVLNSQLVHVGVGHHHHLVHDRVELVVIGDGDGGLGDLAKLAPVVNLVQLHLEVLVLLDVHVVDDGDVDRPLGLAMLELQLTLPAGEIFPRDRRLVDRFPFHFQVAICSIFSQHRKQRFSTALFDQVAATFELESPRFIIVEDLDLHYAGPAQLDPTTVIAVPSMQRWVLFNESKLEEELLIGLPLVVVHNGDAHLLFFLERFKGESFIDCDVVFSLVG